MNPSTIGGINNLDEAEKRAIYARYIPQDLMQRFNLRDLADNPELLQFRFASGASDEEMSLYHQAGFQDPILYAHLTDTMNGQIHVLLYILNDPASPRLLAARSVSWSEVGAALERFNFAWLPVAIVISLAIQLLRALRWQVELSPLARLPYPMVWQVVAVAYMMINVLPFRMGEPVRPLLMSWRSKLPVSAIVGNWVFEKMMDTAAIVVFVHLALLTADLPDWASHASQASLTAFGVMLAVVVVFWLRGERFFDATIGRWLPDHARVKDWTSRSLSGTAQSLSTSAR